MFVYAFGFPKRTTADEVEWAQLRVGARDFVQYTADAEAIRKAGIPVLVAFTDDDNLVEPEVPLELRTALTGETSPVAYAPGWKEANAASDAPTGADATATAGSGSGVPIGRHVTLRYAKGGHYLQKEEARQIGAIMEAWLQRAKQPEQMQ